MKRKKQLKQLIAALLAAALMLPMSAPARAAGSVREAGQTPTGRVEATVRLDYVQTWDELVARDLQAELLRGEVSLGKVSLTSGKTEGQTDCSFEASARNREGAPLDGGTALPGALDLSVTGLPEGEYTLRFTGEGYAEYSVPFKIQDYNQYIEVGTGGGTFALGDFNGDKTVDKADRDSLSEALGSQQKAHVDKYDLNGDGKIDIIDLAYVNRNANTAKGAPVILNTTCRTAQLEENLAPNELKAAGTVVKEGSFADIFRENAAVSFERAGEDKEPTEKDPIVIPVPLVSRIPLAVKDEPLKLQIATPSGSEGSGGTIRKGLVSVEYADGTFENISFDNSLPPGVHAISRTGEVDVITIDLGHRAAVKKITISVTKTEGGNYAVVESIRFLQDIVPENVSEPHREVKNLQATPGSELVKLKWDKLPNVSGYRVKYWQQGQESAVRQLNVSENSAQVTGLKNLETYYFTVTPTDGGWEGIECAPVEAIPQPASAPKAPDMVTVTALDGQLALSWKPAENATYYKVYYTNIKDAELSKYDQFGDRWEKPSVTVDGDGDGLINGTTYYFYVVAGNNVGESGPSRVYLGTPVATDYSAPAGIPKEGLLDNSKIADIELANPKNVDSGSYTKEAPFKIENVIDGDYKTHWTASNWNGDEHVIVTFNEPVDLSAAIWVPRLDGSYPTYLRAYSVRVWYANDPEDSKGTLLVPDPKKGGRDDEGGKGSDVHTWPNMSNYGTITIDRFGILPFGPCKNVKKISIAAEQRDYYTVSLSELMFMEYDPAHCLPDNIAALFADELRTQLADGVTLDQINKLKERLAAERNYYLNVKTLEDELALAQELLNGATSGVVLDGVQSRSNSADAKYKQSGSELQPLGVAAKAGQEITIYADGIPDGKSESVTVYATQFNAEANTWCAEMGTLTNGRNILTVPTIGSGSSPQRGGSLYLTYSGTAPEQIKLHVRRAVDIPVLELSDWYSLNESTIRARIGAYVDELTKYVSDQRFNDNNKATNCLNVTEISMPTVLLSIPAAAVLNANGLDRESKIENLYQNVLAWEDLMHICKTTQGIDNTYSKNDMESRQNIRYMQMFANAFMYAAGSHIGIGYGSCAAMVSGLPIDKLGENADENSLFGWGIAHEIGHNMDKLGRAEITNNIYSLMVQTYDGNKNTLRSRLEASGKYPDIFTKTAQGWPGASNDVFVQLGMYWQLHLAYDDDKPMDFYNRFFKAWKDDKYKSLNGKNLTDDERIALIASETAGKNLTEFFTRWGMILSQEVQTELASFGTESRAIWYLSDQSRRERLKNVSPASGTVDASTELVNEKTVRVTIQSGGVQGTLQGFEILRDGTPVAFVVPGANGTTVYDDVIGSGNHRAYEYQVAAYDVLGNQVGGAVKAGEVRVAYDQTVDPSAYELVRDGNTVTFRFTESTRVSGLKLSGDARPGNGAYTITVDASFTVGEGKNQTLKEKTVTARTGSFDAGNQAVDDKNSYLTYFQKPGAEQDDTRIWTYDAKAVTVTGIPKELADKDIQLISYAGDDVAFLEGGSVGRLDADYRYGDETDDVIKAGTLIIAGTYRGDPRFNIIKIMGRFAKTTAEDGVETVYEERPIDGYVLLFSDIPADKQVSDISDGLFIFVPDVQKEAELQEIAVCDGVNYLPSQMKAVLSRTDLPEDAGSQRETAETLWIMTPGGTDLPAITLKGGAK